MKLLMISGDRSVLANKQSAFWYTLRALNQHWDRIDIICPKNLQKCTSEGISARQFGLLGEIHFHPCPHGLWYQSRWIAKRGQKLVAKHHHQVMTVQSYPPFYNSRGAQRLANQMGIPYALEVHHIVGWPEPASLSERIGLRMSERWLPRAAEAAQAVRVVNKTVWHQLREWGVSEKKLSLVPSFYLDRELLTSVKPPPVIYDAVFCARLVANKGAEAFLEAVAKLPDARALIIGDGPLRSRLEAKAQQLGLGQRVTFSGWLRNQQAVLEAITSARIFVMNSKSEGGPRVLLEAMGAGMPVIATKVGIAPEIIGNGVNGMFTDGSAEDLARVMHFLMKDEKMRERLSEAAVKVLDLYSRDVLVKQYSEFLQGLGVRD